MQSSSRLSRTRRRIGCSGLHDLEGRNSAASAGNYDYLRQRVTTIASLSAAAFSSFNLAGDDQPERILGLRATAGWFDVFGFRRHRPDVHPR